jgi:DNA-binding CsgD family transcriptional regulator
VQGSERKIPLHSGTGIKHFRSESFRSENDGKRGVRLRVEECEKTGFIQSHTNGEQGAEISQFDGFNALKSAKNDQASYPFITRREKEVLLLVEERYTNLEIAQQLFISPSTVDTHWKSLLAKFSMKNTASLVGFVTQHNLI